MNNARADMYYDLVCEHRKLSDAHSKLRLELSKKGNPRRHTFTPFSLCNFFRHTLICRHITFYRHSVAGAEAQVTELVKRVKELIGMPNLANLQLNILNFKSFNLCHCFLSSNPFNFKFFADEKAGLEARHQDCMSSVDVAK
jgi:hypothetical protein